VPVNAGQEPQFAKASMGFLGPKTEGFDGYPYALFTGAEDSGNPNFADGAKIIFPGLANEVIFQKEFPSSQC
jgi:hypothetical protein